ncbi:MAG: formylglycine-generating enzyme family protein [Anaerolineae bacterium]|nr:formylglycine-generating enzyme family protein [Anaerolineae bacterium]
MGTAQQNQIVEGDQVNIAGDASIGQIGDIFNVGDIAGSYNAIGNGAQVIINQIEQALSAVDEMEKGVQSAEIRLARAIQNKIESYTRLPAKISSEEKRNPYRSLLSYRIEDAPFFYGRGEAIDAILARLDRNQLTILQADSGSGKTSLLQAGLAARLLAAKHLPLYVRPYTESPSVAIKRAFLPDYRTLDELARFRDEKMSLSGFLRRVTSYLGSRRLFIFLDQFEEFFGDVPFDRQLFATELQQCVNDNQLDVRWILSLREEYFAKLRLFDAVRPFENWYFLDTFRIEEAREVITQPALKKGVMYEEGLADRIIADIAQGGKTLVPVQVQLVCSTLYDEKIEQEQDDGNVISAEMYARERGVGERKAPGAEGILRSHLARTLQQQMSVTERQLAWRVLRTLVTSQKKRAKRNRQAIQSELQSIDTWTGDQDSELDSVLLILENTRLISTDENDHDGLRYELAHDYLIDEIEIDPRIEARKLAREMLENDLLVYQRNLPEKEILISEERLIFIEQFFEPQALLPEENKLISISRNEINEAKREERERLEREIATQRQLVWRTRTILFIFVAIAIALSFNPIRNEVLRQKAVTMSTLSLVKGGSIENREVSNAQYRLCVEAGRCTVPNSELYASESQDFEKESVYGVNALQASAYCRWLGRQLPTNEQWLSAREIEAVEQIEGGISEWTRTYSNSTKDDVRLWDGDPETLSFVDFLIVRGSSELDSADRISVNGRSDKVVFGIRCLRNDLGG